MKAPKKGTLAWYKSEFDRVFSVFIRIRDDGVCFTCGGEKYWRYQQNGHYVSRSYLATRFDEENCNCQCSACNIFKKGNYVQYSIRLVRKYGAQILEKLDKKKDQIVKFDIPWYKKAIRKYEKKVLDLFPEFLDDRFPLVFS
jgi:NinG protein